MAFSDPFCHLLPSGIYQLFRLVLPSVQGSGSCLALLLDAFMTTWLITIAWLLLSVPIFVCVQA